MAQERSLLPGQNYCDYCSIQRFYAGRHPREYAADGARRYHSMGGLYRALSFATMADLFPGSVFVQTDQSDYANYVEVKQDILVPEQVSVSQRGRLYRNGSCVLEGDLSVDYYQTRWPWLAQQLARELRQHDERLWGKRYQRYEPLELPDWMWIMRWPIERCSQR